MDTVKVVQNIKSKILRTNKNASKNNVVKSKELLPTPHVLTVDQTK